MQNGYSRAQSYRHENYADGPRNAMARPESFYTTTDNQGPANGYYTNRARYPRTASEPQFNNGQGVYPVPGNQQSYETVTTASGSGGSPAEPAGYSTDPSSENSSVDRIAPSAAKDTGETYGFNGFGNNPQFLPPGSGLQNEYMANGANSAQRQGNGYQNQGPPPVPRKEIVQRVPIKLGAPGGNTGPQNNTQQRPVVVEKRKSWFAKRFSRS
jgi:hypothetical protein